MKRFCLPTALLVLLICNAVQAVPSFRGYTGLVKIPSAGTLEAGEFAFGVMTECADEFRANDAFGMCGIGGQVEVGVDTFQPSDGKERKVLVNPKYCVRRCLGMRTGYAIGMIDAADEVQRTGYVVASKSLLRKTNIFSSVVSSVRGHLGFGVGGLDGVFAGLSIFAGNRVMFSAEWDTEEVNLGFTLTPIRGLRLHAAMIDVGGRGDVGVGMSYARTY